MRDQSGGHVFIHRQCRNYPVWWWMCIVSAGSLTLREEKAEDTASLSILLNPSWRIFCNFKLICPFKWQSIAFNFTGVRYMYIFFNSCGFSSSMSFGLPNNKLRPLTNFISSCELPVVSILITPISCNQDPLIDLCLLKYICVEWLLIQQNRIFVERFTLSYEIPYVLFLHKATNKYNIDIVVNTHSLFS